MRRALPLGASLALLPLLSCAPEVPASARRTIDLTPCHLTDLGDPTLCGTLPVWEDRATKTGRKIPLRIAVVPSVRPVADPDPVFIIAGGPGQSAVGIAAMVMPVFEELRQTRDIVFVDQRGTGGSNPLRCHSTDDQPLAESLKLAPDAKDIVACRDGLDANLYLYATNVAMDDLDEARAALGYDKINLYGGSYGTRAALVYLRQHGDHARTVTLDGVAPYDNILFLHFARDVQSAFDHMVKSCEAEPGCHAAFPDPAGDLAAVMAAADQGPTIPFVHPRTGKVESVPMAGWLVASAIMLLEYNPQATSLLPYDLARARAGDWQPLLSQTLGSGGGSLSLEALGFQGFGFAGLGLGGLGAPVGMPPSIRPEDQLADAMQLSVVCSEDLPRLDTNDIAAATAGTFLGDALLQRIQAACADWPRAALPDGFFDPISSDVPTLLLSGAADPVTPPRWAAAAAAHLTHNVQAIAPGGAHINIGNGCGYTLMRDLVQAGSVEGLDPSCMQDAVRPPFIVDALGPAR